MICSTNDTLIHFILFLGLISQLYLTECKALFTFGVGGHNALTIVRRTDFPHRSGRVRCRGSHSGRWHAPAAACRALLSRASVRLLLLLPWRHGLAHIRLAHAPDCPPWRVHVDLRPNGHRAAALSAERGALHPSAFESSSRSATSRLSPQPCCS